MVRNRNSGAVGLFQFARGSWPHYSLSQERLGAQIAENVRRMTDNVERVRRTHAVGRTYSVGGALSTCEYDYVPHECEHDTQKGVDQVHPFE
jgi:hypothetical protein